MKHFTPLIRAIALLAILAASVSLVSAAPAPSQALGSPGNTGFLPAAQATPTPATAQVKPPALFVGLRPAADASVQTFALALKQEGVAEFAQDFGKEKAILEKGKWTQDGKTYTVTITERNGETLAKPEVMKFLLADTFLTLVDYDKATWGESGLRLNLAADIVRKVRSPMVTLDIAAGFPLDPTFVSVNGGGEVDASLLGKGCGGYIHRQPVVTVKWSGEAEQVRAFFLSDEDPTMVVLTPKGELLCNDNATEQILDPFVQIDKPVAGDYRIWIGSAAKNQLIAGVLVLSAKSETDLGTFDLGKLIKRPLISQRIVPPATTDLNEELKSRSAKLAQSAQAMKPGDTASVDVTADGIIPLFKIPAAAGKGCGGLVNGAPSFAFQWTGQTGNLHVAFKGDADSTLMVVGQGSKLVLCNDDAAQGDVNPAIDIPNPADDTYMVYVGRISPQKPVKGTLTVAESGKE